VKPEDIRLPQIAHAVRHEAIRGRKPLEEIVHARHPAKSAADYFLTITAGLVSRGRGSATTNALQVIVEDRI
jgi:hypothetical protein